MKTNLFRKTDLPAFNTPYGDVSWCTWSDEFRAFMSELKQNNSFAQLKPDLIFIERFNEYNYTHHIDFSSILSVDKHKQFQVYAESLYAIDLPQQLLFFTGLIDNEITAEDMHTLFAVLRSSIVTRYNNEMEALYTPLTVSNKGYFPLHCDLYIPRTLFNVYENVPSDSSGASIFMTTENLLLNILPGLKTMPDAVKENIEKVIGHNEPVDQYQELYKLLHKRDNAWYKELKEKLENGTFAIKFEKGQGYMLSDRKWLHGRMKPSGALTKKRVHRLVFNSAVEQSSIV